MLTGLVDTNYVQVGEQTHWYCAKCDLMYPVTEGPIHACNLTEAPDMVNHPPHYTAHPSGIEQIEVTGHMNFCLGNAVKYIWRCDEKGKPIEDLKKAIFYLNWEIKRRENEI